MSLHLTDIYAWQCRRRGAITATAQPGPTCYSLHSTLSNKVMADIDGDTAPAPVDVEQEDEHYQPPPAKSIDELLQSDKDDEALQKYKAALLGSAVAGSGAVVVDSADGRSVILKKLSLVSEGREDSTIDLTEDLAEIKTKTFVLKEGVKFRIKIDFIVQREIVHGLKYVQKTYK